MSAGPSCAITSSVPNAMSDPTPGSADFFRRLALIIVEAALAVGAFIKLIHDGE